MCFDEAGASVVRRVEMSKKSDGSLVLIKLWNLRWFFITTGVREPGRTVKGFDMFIIRYMQGFNTGTFYLRFIRKLRRNSELTADKIPSYNQILSSTVNVESPATAKKKRRLTYRSESTRFKNLSVGIKVQNLELPVPPIKSLNKKLRSPRFPMGDRNRHFLLGSNERRIKSRSIN